MNSFLLSLDSVKVRNFLASDDKRKLEVDSKHHMKLMHHHDFLKLFFLDFSFSDNFFPQFLEKRIEKNSFKNS